MKTAVVTVALASVAASVLGGCVFGGVAGSGAITNETRQVASFDRVQVSGGIGVTVHVGPAQSVQLATHENLHSIIATDVGNGVLNIHGTTSYTAAPAPQVTITVPSLNGVSASGGSQITADSIASDMFGVDLSGGSAFTGSGTAKVVALDASGGARANMLALAATSVVLDVSGGSVADVNATAEVTGDVTGGARATVTGGAAVRVDSSGGGQVVSQ